MKAGLIAICIGIAGLLGSFAISASVLPYHVCAAMLCYAGFLACVICNIGICAGKRWPMHLSIVFCDVGLLFALATMGTGAWWGYHAWGAAWVWEPRITGMLLMTLIFLSWRISCSILGDNLAGNRKYTATLLVLGLPSMFFTHVAVRFFGGIHPGSIATSGSSHELWYSFLIVGLSELLIGLGVGLADRARMKKAGRMAQQAP